MIGQHGAPGCSGNSAAATFSSGTMVVRAPQRCRRRANSDASTAAGATMRMSLPVRSGTANGGSSAVAVGRQRQRDPEGRALAGGAFDRDRAGHALDNALGNGEAEPDAVEFPRRADIGLLEFVEDARLIFGDDADAGVAHSDGDASGRSSGSTMIETPPRSVNLMALPTRLNSTWRSRAASPTTRAGSRSST